MLNEDLASVLMVSLVPFPTVSGRLPYDWRIRKMTLQTFYQSGSAALLQEAGQ
ncbi:MAG: hypothetical protein ACR2HJ_09880 [Fimbriimonadales bacterium]